MLQGKYHTTTPSMVYLEEVGVLHWPHHHFLYELLGSLQAGDVGPADVGPVVEHVVAHLLHYVRVVPLQCLWQLPIQACRNAHNAFAYNGTRTQCICNTTVHAHVTRHVFTKSTTYIQASPGCAPTAVPLMQQQGPRNRCVPQGHLARSPQGPCAQRGAQTHHAHLPNLRATNADALRASVNPT